MNKRRVVVTGLGMVSPVGNDVATAWKHVVDGVSGIGPITHFDAMRFPTHIAGEVKDFDAARYIARKDIKKMDTFIHYAVAAGEQALRDSGLEINDENANRIGAAVGAGIGGIANIERTAIAYHEGESRKISPFFVPGTIVNMASGYLAILHGFKGPNIACVTACATATHNIGLAMRMIQYGDADAMLTGGAEFAITISAVGGFCSAHAMSTRNDDPTRASRPWDKDRDGFVLSDGAGVLMLEEWEQARARGARIYAELVGFGMSGDACHMTAPPEDGNGARRAMEAAMADAGVGPDAIDYVNAHATSTDLGDIAEVRAIKGCFGDHVRRMPVSSTKSVTGHMVGAAGGAEAIFTLLAMRDGILPPTINLDQPDVGCDLDFVPNTAREGKIDVAISNSFGFGGTNGTLLFKRV